MTDIIDINKIKLLLKSFAKSRDWEKFHSVKNLSMALNVESSELLEISQWMSEEQSNKIVDNQKLKQDVAYEIADIMMYAIRISDILDINLSESILQKIEVNNEKYPVEIVKGSSKKYSKY